MSISHEVGVVYRKNSRYYLAISHDTLVTFIRGKRQEVKPYVRYEVIRSISVEELVEHWGITLEELDKKVSGRFLAPTSEGIKKRPRGTKRAKQEEEAFWIQKRKTRVSPQ